MSFRIIRPALIFSLMISLGVFAQAVAQDQDKPAGKMRWFDMDHCAICANLASQKQEMHRIKWELHQLDNGTLTISVIPEDMKKGMSDVEKGIEKTVGELMSGKALDLCGYCETYGQLMGMGAKFKDLKTVGGKISIITSSDSEIVEQIHAFGERSKVEHAKMLNRIKASAAK